jgi:hypothetical protein
MMQTHDDLPREGASILRASDPVRDGPDPTSRHPLHDLPAYTIGIRVIKHWFSVTDEE